MTRELVIPESTGTAKVRNPLLVLVLGYVTFGIYQAIWYYKINREMRDLGRAHNREWELGTSPSTSTLAITVGQLLVVPYFVSLVHTNRRVRAAEKIAGRPTGGRFFVMVFKLRFLVIFSFVLLFLVVLFFPVLCAAWQRRLNTVWNIVAPAGSVPASESRSAVDPTRPWPRPGSTQRDGAVTVERPEPIEQLERLADLRDRDLITEAEFGERKARILDRG